jgi:tripartite-type tricarboxylate transporter receptor subunit TctC
MIIHRRQLLQLAAAALLAPAGPATACSLPEGRSRLLALMWPARPIHLVVASAAGSATDIVARLIGQWLSERLGQNVIVENRTGGAPKAGSALAGDAYTLFAASAMNAAGPASVGSPDADATRDTAPIAAVAVMPLVMAVNPSFPADTAPAFIARAKAAPGGISIASSGRGSPSDAAADLFRTKAGVDMAPVVSGGDDVAAIENLLAGRAQVHFAAMPAVIDHIRAGRLRALAVTGATRSPVLPGVAAVAEFLPGYEVTLWTSLLAPARIPHEIAERLNSEIDAVLADPAFTARLAALGATVPAETAALIAAETRR